jgi:tRNA pseudouridine38-40 synthase
MVDPSPKIKGAARHRHRGEVGGGPLPVGNLGGEFRTDAFVRVETQYPFMHRLLRGVVLLLRITFPMALVHASPTLPRDLAGAIAATGVHHDHFIAAGQTRNRFRNSILFIQCDDRRADSRHPPYAITEPMRNLKLTLAYDGTEFHGWQIQPEVPTIQGELERAFGKLFNHEVHATGSGRTDAGVHAHAQVASVQTERTMDTDAVLRGANALLPREIRIFSVEEVSPEFHPRHSAKSKTYEYHLWRHPIVSPFHCRYVHPFRYLLDEDAMDSATREFTGTHDFTSFCATATEVEDRVRTVFSAEWHREEITWTFRIRGNGFLQYMVRTIAGTILEAGGHRLNTAIPEIFEAKDRRLAGPSLPAAGLHLMAVEY